MKKMFLEIFFYLEEDIEKIWGIIIYNNFSIKYSKKYSIKYSMKNKISLYVVLIFHMVSFINFKFIQ